MPTPTNLPLLQSLARTATVNDTARYNYPGFRGVIVVVDVTAQAGGSITPELQYYDDLSGQWKRIVVAQAARTTVGQTVLRVYPSALDAAVSPDANSNFVLPLIWRLVVTHNNGSSITYTASALLLP